MLVFALLLFYSQRQKSWNELKCIYFICLVLFLYQTKTIASSATMINKITSLFPSDFKSVFVWHLTGKILSFEFHSKAVFLSESLRFHGLPLFTFKPDRLDLDWTEGWRIRWRQRFTSLKLQHVNTAHCKCTYKTRVLKSESSKLPYCILRPVHRHALHF